MNSSKALRIGGNAESGYVDNDAILGNIDGEPLLNYMHVNRDPLFGSEDDHLQIRNPQVFPTCC